MLNNFSNGNPPTDGIVLTEEMMSQMERKLKPEELPDPLEISETIVEILEYMCNDEVSSMKNENRAAYEEMIETKFQAFANRYRGIFSLTVSGENMDMLEKMLLSLNEIRCGNIKMEDAENGLKKELAEEYVLKNMDEKEKENIRSKLGF